VLSERWESLQVHPLLAALVDAVDWVSISSEPFVGNSSVRMARLRQRALNSVKEEFVAFLDDDNAITPDHFARLHACIEAGADAAYSWRRLELPDGRPFDGSWYPWHPDPDRSATLHAWCVASGMIVPGSDVVRDGPIDNPHADNVATVDMNEWLFRTQALRRVGFECQFTPDEIANQVGEDDKLLARVRATGMRLGCSNSPTVLYRLGGVSNRLPPRLAANGEVIA
jgi:glycosyltransferase involved in cell wall biosynthesis